MSYNNGGNYSATNNYSTSHTTPFAQNSGLAASSSAPAAPAPAAGTGVAAKGKNLVARVKNMVYKCLPFLKKKTPAATPTPYGGAQPPSVAAASAVPPVNTGPAIPATATAGRTW